MNIHNFLIENGFQQHEKNYVLDELEHGQGWVTWVFPAENDLYDVLSTRHFADDEITQEHPLLTEQELIRHIKWITDTED